MALLKDSSEIDFQPTLSERVEALIRPHSGRARSTTGTRAATGRLEDRTLALEQAIREIARELDVRSSSR